MSNSTGFESLAEVWEYFEFYFARMSWSRIREIWSRDENGVKFEDEKATEMDEMIEHLQHKWVKCRNPMDFEMLLDDNNKKLLHIYWLREYIKVNRRVYVELVVSFKFYSLV